MVHQHFMLIPPLTVAQNVCIGLRSAGYPFPDLRRVAGDIRHLASQYGLQVDPDCESCAALGRRPTARRNRQGALPWRTSC